MKTTTKLFFAVIAVAAVPVFAACGGDIGAGKYAEFRLATVALPKESGDCQPNTTHVTNFESGSTVLIYGISGSSGDELFLDTGGKEGVLDGTKQDDGSFVFTGKATDTMVQGPTTTISETDISVTFTVTGKTLSGSTIEKLSVSCSGQCGGFQGGECTSTFNFDGVEVQNPQAPDPA
jgi:hypothetical protein